jgi:hypothetical protein
VLVESVDLHALIAGFVAGDKGDIAARKVESFSEKGDQRVVCGAVNRRRRKPDKDSPSTLSVNARAGRSRKDANIDRDRQLQTADC